MTAFLLGLPGVGILTFRAWSWVRRARRLSEGRWGETLAAVERATRPAGLGKPTQT